MSIKKTGLPEILVNLIYIGIPMMIATGMATAFQPLTL